MIRRYAAICVALAGCALAPALSAQSPDQARNPAAEPLSQAWATAKIARSPRRHEWVAIPHGDRNIRAFVTYPDHPRGRSPVVIVLHEVFGLTDSTRNTADEIAAMGYVTVAPDMLSGLALDGGGTASFPTMQAAGDVTTALPDATIDGAIDAVAAYGRKLPGTADKLAIVGLSWGGGAAFRYAASGRADAALKAVAVFYDVGPPQETQGPSDKRSATTLPVTALSVPVYGFYPSRDQRVMNALPATRAAMAAAGKPFDAEVYEGADHAYMRVGENPANTNPANAAAVRASLGRLADLLGRM